MTAIQEIKHLPNSEHIEQCLKTLGITLSTAECHGLVCGVTCISHQPTLALNTLFELATIKDKNQHVLQQAQTELESFCHITFSQLADINFGFKLLLPDDKTNITERAQAIGEWSQGFISGLGESLAKFKLSPSEELQDTVKDLTAIAQIDINNLEGTEEEEFSFNELSEYIRIIVMSIYTEFLTGTKDNDNIEKSKYVH